MKNEYTNPLGFIFLLIIVSGLFASSAFAQSSDPDQPTVSTNGVIEGENNSNLHDDKTYYYTFNVKPGTLTLTVDMTPVKGTGGGTLAWHYLDAKFKQLRYDIYSASSAPERNVNDVKVTVKRKIILKIVTGGKFSYKLHFSGTAIN